MITGSRYFPDTPNLVIFERMLEHCDVGMTMLSGACKSGADHIAERIWCDIFDLPIERFPADFATYGKRGAYLRTREMVKKQPLFCLAFPMRGKENKGTNLTIREAKKENIKVYTYWDDDDGRTTTQNG